MPGRDAELGALLVDSGIASADELAELLIAQRTPMPLASLAYAFGLADEESLARVVSRQLGVPAVVLDRSIIALDLFDGVAAELALSQQILPLTEDARHLFVAAEDPASVAEVLREIEFVRGKTVVAHAALGITLRRAMRAGLRGRQRGQRFLVGSAAEAPGDLPPGGSVVVVSDLSRVAPGPDEARAQRVLQEEVTKEMMLAEIIAFDRAASEVEIAATTGLLATGTAPSIDEAGIPMPVPQDLSAGLVSARTWVKSLDKSGGIGFIDLDASDGPSYSVYHDSPPYVLVVDDDQASSNLLVKELTPLGCRVETAASGESALLRVTADPPDAMIVDLMLPEIDGAQVCRAIKRSKKYRGIAVILTSAMADSARVTDEMVSQCGADDYIEKPIDIDDLRSRIKTLLAVRALAPQANQSFEVALALYRAGDIDGAVEELRRGIEEDPSSAKHHFVLANLLHKKSLIYEAIDEYEATVELRPDYFPALTRLAYLYYRQGYAAKAIDTWRRSLPLCPDASLRQNIEVFMRKLIADLES